MSAAPQPAPDADTTADADEPQDGDDAVEAAPPPVTAGKKAKPGKGKDKDKGKKAKEKAKKAKEKSPDGKRKKGRDGDDAPAELGKRKGKLAKLDKAMKAAQSGEARDAAAPAATPAAPPDDLKQIRGVGPKLERLLNDNGVTAFGQIARWGDAEIDHFAALIGRMGGRIRSDDWVAQARTLAAGGQTEFSDRVDKGEVY